uniref:Uncharacterized protein n=1 Tax=viral metagenome TaxID=1070528 RepID=A0A6C0HI09_9ZZZZ
MEPITKEFEMKTIRTNIVPPKRPAFKILRHTKCVNVWSYGLKSKVRYTSITIQPGEIYWGNIIVNKNRIYIDISECYKSKMPNDAVNIYTNISICIPVVFDMTGKYMLNICEYIYE